MEITPINISQTRLVCFKSVLEVHGNEDLRKSKYVDFSDTKKSANCN